MRAIFDRIAAERPGFLCILGDLTFEGWNPTLWQRFDMLAEPVRTAGIPVYPLFGNHEFLLDQPVFKNRAMPVLRREMEYQFFGRFSQLEEHSWYALRWRDVAIIMLNSNFINLTPEEVDRQDREYAAMLRQYESDTAVRSVIVACHHPPYSNGVYAHGDEAVRNHFLEPFNRSSKTVLFIAGHCHSYQRFEIAGKTYIVSGGAGPQQPLTAPAADALEQDKFIGPLDHRPHHFCRIGYEGTSLVLRVQMLSDDLTRWSPADSIILRK